MARSAQVILRLRTCLLWGQLLCLPPLGDGLRHSSGLDEGMSTFSDLFCSSSATKPFRGALPDAEQAVPSLEELLAHVAGPAPESDYYTKTKSACLTKTPPLPGSARAARQAAAAEPAAKGATGFAQGIPDSARVADQAAAAEPAEMAEVSAEGIADAPGSPDHPGCYKASEGSAGDRGFMLEGLAAVLEAHGFGDKWVIVQYGDSMLPEDPLLPLLMKAISTPRESAEVIRPTLTYLNVERHFYSGSLAALRQPGGEAGLRAMQQFVVSTGIDMCRPFAESRSRLKWRGATTGSWEDGARHALLRQWWNKGSAERIDVGVSSYCQGVQDQFGPESSATIADMAADRYGLSVQGNDVASDSAWRLLVPSVPVMVKPSKETMAFHGLLKPGVHYLEVKEDFSDLEERMQWCDDNLEDCEAIAHRSSLFMQSLWPGTPLANEVTKRALNLYFERYGEVIDCYCGGD